MELNSYQRRVIGDLKDYLDCVEEAGSLKLAWQKYWADRDKDVGFGGVAAYKDKIAGVPHVCIKVPTGGGKTFMACAAVQKIFRRLLRKNFRLVIWLVPSEAILSQTIANLSNAEHPYRARLDADFGGRVEICTKEMLLQGQNFTPTTVAENLTVCVMSYASIRIDSRKKDIRKVYQENGALMSFAEYFGMEPTLINILQEMAPVVIVDESHNAGSELSVEMLQNLSPSFILELTATPRASSNVISYVNARELKAEHMVKLPVVVFKKDSLASVLADAIAMRNKMEAQALENEKRGGRYIRPIVLFQAQPNISENSATFGKIKEKLMKKFKIPEKQIAIKTSAIKKLDSGNLLSRKCEIRYIITVNALKEGWDCPFAYILASLANRNSSVEVEQIVGRILRQPYAERHGGGLLNLSCVFTSSIEFGKTLDKIVAGLEGAGFTKDECRVADYVEPAPKVEQPPLDEIFALETENAGDNLDEVETSTAPEISQERAESDAVEAERQAEEFESNFGQKPWVEAGSNEPVFEIRAEFRESVAGLKIPQFFHKVLPNLFGEDTVLLEKEALAEGFRLSQQDANVNFSVNPNDVYQVDIYEEGAAIPVYKKILGRDRQFFMNHLKSLPPKNKFNQLVVEIAEMINPSARISTREVQDYVRRALGDVDEGELEELFQKSTFYADRIQLKINELLKSHRRKNFGTWLDTGEITCEKYYAPPAVIGLQKSVSSIPKSLYTAEMSNMNELERRMADEFAVAENVRWWHRIIDRRGFRLNGYINHYPDFLVMTQAGRILLVEAKGDYLDNDDTNEKISLGRDWQMKAGNNYRYFMVFDNKDVDGAYNYNRFLDVIRAL